MAGDDFSTMNGSPPPPPAGTTVRQWFAGLALMNPELMKNIAPEKRVVEAIKIADELVLALSTPRIPSTESLAAPTDDEMARWDKRIEENKSHRERMSRATMPDGLRVASRATSQHGFGSGSIIPPPTEPIANVHFREATQMLKRASSRSMPAVRINSPLPNAGRYSMFALPAPEDNEEK